MEKIKKFAPQLALGISAIAISAYLYSMFRKKETIKLLCDVK
jgi:hypothetical protein